MKYMHRDIKPGNVLLSGDPKSGKFVAKLTDFGLAVRVRDASVTNELTAETGTYRYMAPGAQLSDFFASIFA
jgi:serine/threonine protein kinase